jgi:hypothetical protein
MNHRSSIATMMANEGELSGMKASLAVMVTQAETSHTVDRHERPSRSDHDVARS